MSSVKKETTVTDETRERIERALENWNSEDSEPRQKFNAAVLEYKKELHQVEEAVAASVNLTAEDFAVRINARD